MVRWKSLNRHAMLALASATSVVHFASLSSLATTGTWNLNAAGTWANTSGWVGGVVPNGVGDVANITADISAARTITINTAITLGTLNLGDSTTGFFAYTLNNVNTTGSLTFDQTGVADAVINVPNVGGGVSNSIASGFILNDNLNITTDYVSATVTQMNIGGTVTDGVGSHSITKNGQGIIAMSNASNSYSGGTVVNGGRLSLTGGGVYALGSGSATVNSGGQIFVNASGFMVPNNFILTGTGHINVADTTALAGALRVASGKTLAGSVTIAAGGARIGGITTETFTLGGALLGSGNLEINSTATTTGGVTLLGSGSGYNGTLSLANGRFEFAQTLGGNVSVTPVSGSTVTLAAGTGIAGNLTIDSTTAAATLRNPKGTVAVGGNLSLSGVTNVALASVPAPGTSNVTVMTVGGTITGTAANLALPDAASYRGTPSFTVGSGAVVLTGLSTGNRTWSNSQATGNWDAMTATNWLGGDTKFGQGDAVTFGSTAVGSVAMVGTLRPYSVAFTNPAATTYTLTGTTTGIDAAPGGISVSGGGRVTLNGSNTFTGPVTISSGKLVMGTAQALGNTSGVTVSAGGALDINGKGMIAISRFINLSIAGTGTDGTGALVNSGAAVFAGSPTSGIRNLTLTADATIGGSGAFDIGGDGFVQGNGFTLTKVGAGTVTINGPVTNMNTVINGGTVAVVAPGGFGSTLTLNASTTATLSSAGTFASTLSIPSGGTLNALTNADATWSGPISVGGNLELSNQQVSTISEIFPQTFTIPGNLVRSGNGNVQLLGTVTVIGTITSNGGILTLGNGGTTGAIGGTSAINMTGVGPGFTVNRSDDVTIANDITGAGIVNVRGGGKLTLTGANTYSSTTNIFAGILEIGNGGTTGTLGNGAGTVSNSATLAFNRSDSVSVNNRIIGTGNLLHTGSGTTSLTGSAAYTGSTFVSGGVLSFDGLHAPTVTSSTTLTVGSLGQATVGNTASFYTVASGSSDLSVSGTLNIKSASTADVSTVKLLTGAGTVTLDKGTLNNVSGPRVNALTLTNGAVAVINTTDADGASAGLQGSAAGVAKISVLSVDATSKLDLKNNGLIIPSGGQINGSGITVDNLRAVIIAGRGGTGTGAATWSGAGGIGTSTFAFDETFDSIGYAWTGDPNILVAPTDINGESYSAGDYVVKYCAGADADLNGLVDDTDVAVIGLTYDGGATTGHHWYEGDFNYDGKVNDDDVAIIGLAYNPGATPLSPSFYAALSAEYGASFASAFAAGAGTVVPEPTSLGLLAVGAMGLLRRRRK